MPPPDDPQLTLSRLAYEQAMTALARQQQLLDGFSAKATGLLSADIVSTALFGGWVQATLGRFTLVSWCAILSAGVAAAFAIAVVLPPRNLDLRPLPGGGPGGFAPTTSSAVHEAFARYLDAAYRRNEPSLARTASKLRRSAAFVAIAALWWVANLAIGS